MFSFICIGCEVKGLARDKCLVPASCNILLRMTYRNFCSIEKILARSFILCFSLSNSRGYFSIIA
ncbi:hypothetical protein LguiB_021336 [Lonicera macranthoides]